MLSDIVVPRTQPLIDGHLHLFSHKGVLRSIPTRFVGFADIELDAPGEYTSGKLIDMYKNMFKKLEKRAPDTYYMLCTALTAEDAISVYKAFPAGTFHGFGELKLYDEYDGNRVPYKKISTVRKLAGWIERNHKGNLPIYIHWALKDDKDVRLLGNLLKDFPDQNIVLCHCGIDLGFMARDDSRAEWSWQQAAALARTYTNLWLDVSWDALKYLSNNPFLLYQAPMDRMFTGTDRNPAKYKFSHPRYTDGSINNSIGVLSNYIQSDSNIKHLFA